MTFKFHKKSSLGIPVHASALLLAALVTAQAQAAPAGGTVVGGAGSIGQTGNETTITQDSQRLAIDWDSFNVASDELVRFIQPGQDAIALNRILSNDASQILGQLQANGHVVLVNPNGVIFGEGATVDVGGLVASGLNIDPTDFINGELSLQAEGGNGVVINRGLINAATGGNVVLLGQQVINEGLIEAELGSVALAAGKAAVLTFEPNGLIGVRVSEAVEKSLLGDEAGVVNSGEVEARSGRILLTASASSDVFSQAVNSGDMAYESEVVIHEDGSFTLGSGADVEASGYISTYGVYEGGQPAIHSPGSIAVVGENVRVSGSMSAEDGNENVAAPADAADIVVVAKNNLTMEQGHISLGSEYRWFEGGDEQVVLLGREIDLVDSSIFSSNRLRAQIGGDANGNGINATTHIHWDAGSRLDSWNDASIDVWASESVIINGDLVLHNYNGDGFATITSLGALGLGGRLSVLGDEANGSVILQAPNLYITESATPTSIGEVAFQQLARSSDLTLKAQNDIEFGTAERGVAIAVNNTSRNPQTLNLEAGGDVLFRGSYIRLEEIDTSIEAGGSVVFDTSRLLAPSSTLSITAACAIDIIDPSAVDARQLILNPYTDPLSVEDFPESILPFVADQSSVESPPVDHANPAPTLPPVVAGPTGGKIVGGTGSITQAAKETTIVQDSNRLAINWQTFNIAADERVEFIQPSANAIALNRVLSCDASQILGQLDANGHVLLVNPNGVFFSENATVDVGGLVASGLNIKPAEFMAGGLTFSGGSGAVVNEGSINTVEGGNVVLLGKRVANAGVIDASYGNVALAAGKSAELTEELNGLLGVRVTAAVTQKSLGSNPAVDNSGEVLAEHGRILLTASASDAAFSAASSSTAGAHQSDVLVLSDAGFTLGEGARVVNTGNIDSGRISGNDEIDVGSVVLLGSNIVNSGRISADTGFLLNSGSVVLAASEQVKMEGDGLIVAGGWGASQADTIALLGQEIVMRDRARITSGELGNVIIGARAAASEDSLLRDTETVLLGEGTYVSATGRYDGGTIRSWSRNSTVVEGGLSTSAPVGGAIELVTEGTLGFSGTAVVNGEGREDGQPGTLLLQAPNLSVTAEKLSNSIHDETLNSALSWGHVTLRSQQDIALGGSPLITALVADAPIPLTGSEDRQTRSLTLEAGRNVTFDNVFLSSPSLDLMISAGEDVTFNDVRMRVGDNRFGLQVSAGNDVEFIDSAISWPWSSFIEAGGVVRNVNSTPFADYVVFGEGTVVVMNDEEGI